MSGLLVIGAGGHGRVVSEAAELMGMWDRLAFLDDVDEIPKTLNFEIIGRLSELNKFVNNFEFAFVALGNNEKRLEWIDKAINAGFVVPTIIHKNACISKYSYVGEGSVILSGAVINVNCRLGKGSIVNINSTIDHDCEIGEGVHISTGAVVRSMCKIGRLSLIGAASFIKSNSNLVQRSTVHEGEVF